MSLDSWTLPKREIILDAPLDPLKKTRAGVLFAETGLRLEEVSLTGKERDLLLTHYAGSKSIIGRRLFYRIWYNGQHAGIVGLRFCGRSARSSAQTGRSSITSVCVRSSR